MSGDVDALTVILRRGAHNVRAQDESRHEAMARAVLGSDWLREREDYIRAEALAPVLALADECERLDAYLSHDVTDLTSPMGWRGVNRPAWEVIRTAAALRVAAGTPTHHTTEEDA